MVDSVLEVQNIKLPDSGATTGADVFTSTGNVPTIASGVTFPAGHIIQIVQHVENGIASITSSATNTFASFSVPFQKGITPISSSSKILVSVNMSVGHDNGSVHTALYRDGSKVTGAAGTPAGNRFGSTTVDRQEVNYIFGLHSMSFNYLDSPTIPSTPVQIVYEVRATLGASYTDDIFLNYCISDSSDADYTPRTASFITLFEIAQ